MNDNPHIPELPVRLRVELDDLRARYGVEPTLAEALWMAKACERVDEMAGTDYRGMLGIPVEVCGVRIWPPTVGAICWLEGFPDTWWQLGDPRHYWARVYALANARTPEAFTALSTEEATVAACAALRIQLGCTLAELECAVSIACGNPPEYIPPSVKIDQQKVAAAWDGFVQDLELTSGIPAETWLWGRSMDYLMESYQRHLILRYAMKDSASQLRLDQAVTQLARVKKAIWEARKGDAENV